MKNFLIFFLIIINFSGNSFAATDYKDGFYVGVDPEKTNNKIGNINNAVSLDSKVAEDRYYGYKFREEGFFVAPELFMQNGNNLSQVQNSSTTNSTSQKSSDQLSATSGVTYNVKANLGYEFNPYVSGFVTYDLGSFAYTPGQRNFGVGYGLSNNSTIGVGSQVNLSNSFGVKFSYSQQQFENSAVAGGRIKSDVIKVGTVFSF